MPGKDQTPTPLRDEETTGSAAGAAASPLGARDARAVPAEADGSVFFPFSFSFCFFFADEPGEGETLVVALALVLALLAVGAPAGAAAVRSASW